MLKRHPNVFFAPVQQAALAVAEQQLAQLQQEAAVGQAQLHAQAKEISSLQEVANVHRATIDNKAQQAEETQQQLTELVTMLKVSWLAHASVPAYTVCHFSAHTNISSRYCALWAQEELQCNTRSEITQRMLHGAEPWDFVTAHFKCIGTKH